MDRSPWLNGCMDNLSLSAARVLVVHGGGHIDLAIARSLGRAGARVVVGSPEGRGQARHSRYVEEVLPLEGDTAEMAEQVLHYLAGGRITHLITAEEALIVQLNEHRSRLAQLCEPLFPDEPAFSECLYKERTLARARRLGMEIPKTLVSMNPADWRQCQNWKYPVVFKPAHRDPREARGGVKDYIAQYAEDYPALVRALEALGPQAYPPMIQENIPGEGAGVEALCVEGEPVMLFQHRRVREKPATGGISVLAESMPLCPALAEQAVALLRDLRWDGPAMVEFRRDRTTGKAGLIEINGRFWGSLPLCLAAGADFPAEFLRTRLYPGYRPKQEYRVGVQCRSLAHDTAALAELLRSPGPAPWRAIGAYLAGFRPGIGGYVWASDDPLPALRSPLARLRRPGQPQTKGRLAKGY